MDLATPEGFASDPKRVFGWYAERRAKAKACLPLVGYEVLVNLTLHKKLTVITQNMDRLHQRSGQLDCNDPLKSCTAYSRLIEGDECCERTRYQTLDR